MNVAGRLRNSFVAGLLLVAPLAVTVFVLQFLFDRVTTTLRPVVQRLLPLVSDTLGGGDVVFVAQVLSALVVALAITAVGYAASMSIGQRLFGSFERGVRLIPLVRTIYFGVRQVGESLTEGADAYDKVVLVEYPRDGLFAVGFVTNEAPRAVRMGRDERVFSVFVPHSPNPTVGKLLMAAESELTELDMSVRRGLRLIVTTGLTTDTIEEELPEGVVK